MNNKWTQTTLGGLVDQGVAEVQTGPFGTVLKAAQYSTQGVPLISVGEIRYGHIQVSEHTPRICEETKKRLPQFILNEGDIVFGRKGAIDRNAIINSEQTGWFLGSDGIRLRLKESCNSIFLSYQLRCPAIGEWLLRNSSGSIMPSLNQKILDRLPVWLTDISEQKSIAAVLSALDTKIELNHRINGELEGLAKLLYDYWFVQYDFPLSAAQAAALGKPRLAGQPYRTSGGKMLFNPALKREIPLGWEVGSLLDIATFTNGIACQKFPPTSADNLRVIKIREMRDGFTEKSETVTTDVPEKVIIRDGDILFSWSASLEVMLWTGGIGALN
jgi:type I restriction enzyme, S subunit